MRRSSAIFVVVLFLSAFPRAAEAQSDSDAHVRETLFGEATLASNAGAVCRDVRDLPEDRQFERLLEWVFPNAAHSRLRLDGEFAAMRWDAAVDPRQHVGANILSPALELVDLAARSGRLEELRQRLAACVADDGHAVRSQTALGFLIELEAGQGSAARDRLGRLYDQFAKSSHYLPEDRWPETLATTRGILDPQTQSLAAELADAMSVRLTDNLNGWRTASTPVWDLHSRALFGVRSGFAAGRTVADDVIGQKSLRDWAPGSRESDRSVGDGHSQAIWTRNGGLVRHLAGPWEDYLWYRSPLTGNYQVECEVSVRAWHELQLMAAGNWCGLKWNGRSLYEGTFQKTHEERQLEEPMARLGLWSHMRAIARDGKCAMYFNGRKLSEYAVTEENHPWVALRAGSSSHGAFRNVRITGEPVILDRVELIRNSLLSGWTVPLAEKQVTVDSWQNQNGELVGTLRGDLDGTVCESLISYCRPMLEDGEIEFEFLYEPGRRDVSPAIGRTVFLVEADGVRLHRVTNARFDRSDLEPGNRSDVISDRKLPLRSGEWNRLRLFLRGDVVSLELNGEPICRHTLTVSEQRSFGLFHFADRTEARVRKIVWRGDWPRQLPAVGEQELALPEPECLEGLDALKEVVEYRFTQAIPADEFDVYGELEVRPKPDGLFLSPPVKDAWSAGRFKTVRSFYGDFDAVLRFSSLKQDYGKKGALLVELSGEDDAGTVVGCVRSRGAVDGKFLVAKKSVLNPDGSRRYSGARIEDEVSAGTLRLVRRGAQVHALASHGDSSNYRYVGSNRLPSVVSPLTIQLVVASVWGGRTEVVLQSLVIRSNSKAVEERIDPNVVALDQYVTGFRRRVNHDFAEDGVDGFAVTAPVQPTVGQQGLSVRPQKGSPPDAVSLEFDAPIKGEFDLSASLQILNLPVTDGEPTPVELSLPLPGDPSTRVSLAVVKVSEDVFRVEARSKRLAGTALSESKSEGALIASVEASSIEQLRVIRIQRSLLFVFSEGGVGRLLGQMSCGDDDLPGGAVSLITRLPTESESPGEVRWKQFSVNSTGSK